MDEKENQLMFKFSLFEQQIRQIQEQLQVIDNAIVDTGHLNEGVNELKDGKGKEIFAPIGRGIFIKGRIEERDLMVHVGGGNFVKKSVSETQELIKDQIKKLENVKEELENKLEEINSELTKTFMEAQEKKG